MTCKLMPATLRTSMGVLLLIFSLSAFSHQIWLEQPSSNGPRSGNAQLFFGEYGENLRETTPGLLDKFVKPVASKIVGDAAVPVELVKTPKGFALTARIQPGETLIAEDAAYPMSERKQGEQSIRSVYHPAARLVADFRQQSPRLTLDLVPTGKAGKDGVELQAIYKGQPLPKAKVALVTGAGWAQEHRSGEDGKLTVQLPWRGTYVLELSHSDTAGGEREGQKYDRASYVTSLTLLQPKGLPPLPAVPAATPNKLN